MGFCGQGQEQGTPDHGDGACGVRLGRRLYYTIGIGIIDAAFLHGFAGTFVLSALILGLWWPSLTVLQATMVRMPPFRRGRNQQWNSVAKCSLLLPGSKRNNLTMLLAFSCGVLASPERLAPTYLASRSANRTNLPVQHT